MDNHLKTVNVYNQHVEEYVKKFMTFNLYHDTFEDFLNFLPFNSNVLELGCGPGNIVKHFLSKRKDLKILGIDLAPEMIKTAKTINPNAEFELMDIRNADQIHKQFEAVVGAFCLPYLSYEDLNQFFRNIGRLTLHGGFIYLSFMEGPIEKSGFEKTSFTGENEIYIYYHQRNNVEEKLIENGFVVEKFYTKDYPETDGTFTTDLIYITRKI